MMAKNQKISKVEQEKAELEKMQKRMESVLPPKADIPASFSIQQAEDLKTRLRELEAQLAQQPESIQKEPASTAENSAKQKSHLIIPHSNKNNTAVSESQNRLKTQVEVKDKQFGIWAAGLFTAVGLAFLIYSIYIVVAVQHGRFDLSDKVLMPMAAIMVIGNIISYQLIQRGRHTFGVGLLLFSGILVPPVIAALMLNDFGVISISYISLLAFIMISLIMPKTSRRWTIIATLTAILLIIGIEYWRPDFRINTGIGNFVNAITALAILGLLGVILRQFRDYSLRTKLIIGILLLTIIPLIILGWQTYTTTHDILERQITDEIGRSASSLTTDFQDFLDSQFSTALAQSRTPEIIEYISLPQSQRKGSAQESLVYEKLGTFKKSKPTYIQSYMLLDANGTDILDTNSSRLGSSFAEEEFFTTVLTNKNIYASGLTILSNGDRIIYYAAPIVSTSGELAGMYVVTCNANIIQTTVSQLLVNNQINLPANEYTYIIDSTNYFILAHTSRVEQLYKTYLNVDDPRFIKYQEQGLIDPNNLSAFFTPLPEVIAELSNMGTLKEFQAPAFDGVSTQSVAVSVANSKWIVVTSRPTSVISDLIQQQTRVNVIAGLIIIVIASMVALFISNFFTNPIIQLTRVAESISQGDLSQQADIRRNDEIGVLARTFNAMTYQIQTLVTGLEQRVADRTHDLELASEVGRTITEKVENLTAMLTEATEMIRSKFNLYYTQVYLVDGSGQTIILRAGTGTAGQKLLQRGHRLLVNSSSLNGRAVSEKRPIIVVDTEMSETFLPNPLLPNTRSEMAIPLLIGDKVLGVLDMQSETPDALNEGNLAAFQVLAGQLSVAIQNATLFAQSEEARKQVEDNAHHVATTGWQDFLNGSDRGEKIGYVFDQTEVKPLQPKSKAQSGNALSIPITVTGTDVGSIQVSHDEKEWNSSEAQIIRSIAEKLAQHIDNLRLLSQAEKYRQEAEQTTRRLTREGWEGYLQTRTALAEGYSFIPNEVKTENENLEIESSSSFSLPITVRDEAIGEFMINTNNSDHGAMDEIFSAVVTQLGDHLENLRLIEETEASRSESQKSQEQYALAVSGSNDGIWDWDIANEQIYYSPRWKSMLGFEEHELTRGFQDWEDLIHPEDREYATIALNNYLEQKAETYDVELRLRHKDGTWRWIRDRGKALRDENGKAFRMAGSHSDITERKRSDEIIAQRANQLETVATVSSTAATVLDPDKLLQAVVDLTKERFNVYHTHIYLADDAWNTLMLAAGAGEVGRQMVDTGHAIQMDAEKSLVARASRERKSIIVNDVRNETGFLPNPMLPETRSEMAVPMVAGDKVIGVFDVQADTVGYFTDEDANIYTTLASQVAVALQNARLYVEQAATVTQLRELDRLKSSFLANMSHELRTPLNSILGFADVMLEGLDGPLTDHMNNDLGLIQKNGQHLLHLINDVLDMAKIDSGKMNLNIEKFNVNELFTDVLDITSSLAKEKSLALIIDGDSDQELEINADKIRLRQVMINLVNNAMKFTERGNITIRATHENNHVLISVKDSGIGIPADHLESVFHEFTQVDTTTTRKAGGTGLGLPISRRLINMHSGRLWAESSGVNGEGSTFYVYLPIEAKIDEDVSLIEKVEK